MVEFFASPTGRIARVILGIALFLVGLFLVPGALGVVVMLLGFWPILEAALDFWMFAPLFGEPLSGREIRAH